MQYEKLQRVQPWTPSPPRTPSLPAMWTDGHHSALHNHLQMRHFELNYINFCGFVFQSLHLWLENWSNFQESNAIRNLRFWESFWHQARLSSSTDWRKNCVGIGQFFLWQTGTLLYIKGRYTGCVVHINLVFLMSYFCTEKSLEQNFNTKLKTSKREIVCQHEKNGNFSWKVLKLNITASKKTGGVQKLVQRWFDAVPKEIGTRQTLAQLD